MYVVVGRGCACALSEQFVFTSAPSHVQTPDAVVPLHFLRLYNSLANWVCKTDMCAIVARSLLEETSPLARVSSIGTPR
jgi:hypothetical protein